jgi:hypothetical protein
VLLFCEVIKILAFGLVFLYLFIKLQCPKIHSCNFPYPEMKKPVIVFAVVIILGFLVSARLLAQEASVSGQVMVGGVEVAAYAHVIYTHLATGTTYQTIADSNGNYHIEGMTLPVKENGSGNDHSIPAFSYLVINSIGSSRSFFFADQHAINRAIIYNILGRQVARVSLVSDQLDASAWISHGFWNGKSSNGIPVGDGVYFAAVQASQGLRAVKFVQLRGGVEVGPEPLTESLARTLTDKDIGANCRELTPRYQHHIAQESSYTVQLNEDSLGTPFQARSFTRILYEGENGPFIDTVETRPALRILMIGNSYTAYNGGVNTHLLQMRNERQPESNTVINAITYGGYTLENHWNTPSTHDSIQQGNWDMVILQEQSTRSVNNPDLMFIYARLFDQEIRASGAGTGFFMTWAWQSNPGVIVPIAAAYDSMRHELGALVAPVGLAWQRSIQQDSTLNLYEPDGSHPNAWGTYLTCCVFYAAIWNENPVGIQYVISPHITDEEQEFLQTIAWETWEEYSSEP